MVYGSHESTPYEHEGRSEPDDVRSERKADAARDVLKAASRCAGWFTEEQLSELTPETMRAIASTLASHAFKWGPVMWLPVHAALRREWDSFIALDEEARAIDDAAQECAF